MEYLTEKEKVLSAAFLKDGYVIIDVEEIANLRTLREFVMSSAKKTLRPSG